jgi:hypothetical protein
MNPYDRIVIALGNFYHDERTLKECWLKLADFISMGLLIGFLGFCILS